MTCKSQLQRLQEYCAYGQLTWPWDTGIQNLGIESPTVAITHEAVKQPFIFESVVKGHMVDKSVFLQLQTQLYCFLG